MISDSESHRLVAWPAKARRSAKPTLGKPGRCASFPNQGHPPWRRLPAREAGSKRELQTMTDGTTPESPKQTIEEHVELAYKIRAKEFLTTQSLTASEYKDLVLIRSGFQFQHSLERQEKLNVKLLCYTRRLLCATIVLIVAALLSLLTEIIHLFR